VDAKSDSAVINSDTIAKMLSEDALVEIDLHEAKANDMVVYFDNGKVTHAATLGDKGMFRSKWGGNEYTSTDYGKCPLRTETLCDPSAGPLPKLSSAGWA
jgi:hypothetical protein